MKSDIENGCDELQQMDPNDEASVNGNVPLTRTQRLDELILSTATFLTEHPKPPISAQAGAIRTQRRRRLPARLQDYVIDQQKRVRGEEERE